MTIRMRPSRGLLLGISGVAILLLASLTVSGQAASGQAQEEGFTGFAINMNSGPTTATVDVVIDRWSIDEERDALLAILAEEADPYQANEPMLTALQNHQLVLENYGQQPVRFNEIRRLQ